MEYEMYRFSLERLQFDWLASLLNELLALLLTLALLNLEMTSALPPSYLLKQEIHKRTTCICNRGGIALEIGFRPTNKGEWILVYSELSILLTFLSSVNPQGRDRRAPVKEISMVLRTVGTMGRHGPIEEIGIALRVFPTKRFRGIFFPHEPQHEVAPCVELIPYQLLGILVGIKSSDGVWKMQDNSAESIGPEIEIKIQKIDSQKLGRRKTPSDSMSSAGGSSD
jgi:hypothetical protein